ncbi:ribonuclease D [Brachybacterium tyrofermentans]|uniref:ribonuclease D n=1 Tax=Brachybacterium tyrofermentans TaxID=47848 RepID=UPI003FD1C063
MPIQILDDLTPELAQCIWETGICAVDTETSGLDWRTDRLEICQLFTPSTGPLIVRNRGARPPVLAAVLESRDVQSIYHFAPFDLRFLERYWGIRARRIGCTKTVSRIVNPDLSRGSHSLKPLVRRRLGIELDKGSVRTSDWGARALSSVQLDYAADDVRHLLPLHEQLIAELAEDRRNLYDAMCTYIPADAHREVLGIPDPLTH